MKIAVFSTKDYDRQYFSKVERRDAIKLKFFDVPLKKDTVSLAEGYEGVCVFVNDHLDREVIDALASYNIRLIALRCAGFNNVDLKAAEKNDITVVRVPAYSPEAVAEHALALILTLNRKTHKAYNRIREGNFSLERLIGFDVHKKTVGVIGTGKIGAHFCRITKGLGCKVLATDFYPSEELKSYGIQYVEQSELVKQADIISLHCPLNEHTHHLINEDTLSVMKDGVMLINTSRGGLIDTSAVIEALKSGKVGYLGIDVYEQEEQLFFQDLSESVIQDDQITRLISFPNVLITAHQGFLTAEALTEIATTTIGNIEDFMKGKSSDNVVRSS
ncbi:2-hydroxyacid dehydrogenase [Robertkochia aurantiaca]|uniref:2-hydroxyacid dehydrogenase n=1 Tax=Robertkochia aurantiaca TaxID=2873700 RepID=UPI001CC95356|nr:2-hydroxyacid dehydrogenase [Robertkochia sp. 3YJGBD-33]